MFRETQRALIKSRSALLKQLRSFFDARGYLEVDTPLLAPALLPEAHITPFSTQFLHPFAGNYPLYLIPSPEVYMKRLLSHGSGDIYQINRCFRNEEQVGREHNPEFTMLEWYTLDADYLDSLKTAQELLAYLAPLDTQGICSRPAEVMTVQEACMKHAGLDLEKAQSISEITEQAVLLGLTPPTSNDAVTWEEIFNRVFLSFVEPELPKDRPCFLKDYPSQIPCLAKEKPGTPWKERWELYLGGRELANCYSEETDPDAVYNFCSSSARAIAKKTQSQGTETPELDLQFPKLYESPHPPCSGTALGVDRLLMALTGTQDIGGVILFPLSDIL